MVQMVQRDTDGTQYMCISNACDYRRTLGLGIKKKSLSLHLWQK